LSYLAKGQTLFASSFSLFGWRLLMSKRMKSYDSSVKLTLKIVTDVTASPLNPAGDISQTKIGLTLTNTDTHLWHAT
jgi:hypothetical protein